MAGTKQESDRMKKVLVIAPYTYLPSRSGGQKYIAQWLEALSRKVTLTVASTAANDRSLAGSYNLIPLLANSFFRYADFTLRATLRELIARNRYDLIIWEHPYFGWLADQIKKDTGIYTVIHTHNIEFQRFRSLGKWWWPLLRVYEKNTFSKADKICFISPEDLRFATEQWGLSANKCLEIPYGIPQSNCPDDREKARELICHKHQIEPKESILIFNGALDYTPNQEALNTILHKINPLLQQRARGCYRIIICGKGLPKKYKGLAPYNSQDVFYVGFVEDLDIYLKAADLLLNPVQKGGGVKTKMIEALGMGTSVIATRSGALGIDYSAAGPMLKQVDDNDWEAFAEAILQQLTIPRAERPCTDAAFYKKYNWDSILEKVITMLPDQLSR